jgi:hypothetical protein
MGAFKRGASPSFLPSPSFRKEPALSLPKGGQYRGWIYLSPKGVRHKLKNQMQIAPIYQLLDNRTIMYLQYMIID